MYRDYLLFQRFDQNASISNSHVFAEQMNTDFIWPIIIIIIATVGYLLVTFYGVECDCYPNSYFIVNGTCYCCSEEMGMDECCEYYGVC